MSAAALESVAVGRATDDRTRIVRSVLQLLEPLTKRQGQYLESLDFYQGEFGDADQVITLLRGRSPAILVAVGGANYDSASASGRKYKIEYQVELAVVSQHLTSMEARGIGGEDRFIASADPGLSKMMDDVRAKLAGKSLNISGAKRLRPTKEDIIQQDKDLSIFSFRFSLSMAFCQPRNSDPNPTKATSSEGSITVLVEPTQ